MKNKIMRNKLLALALLSISATIQAETVFVSLEKDNALALVDPVEGKLLKTVPIGQRPRGLALSTDNKFLFVATSDDNTIRMLDAETLKELAKLPSGKDPETFALSPNGDKLYVSLSLIHI